MMAGRLWLVLLVCGTVVAGGCVGGGPTPTPADVDVNESTAPEDSPTIDHEDHAQAQTPPAQAEAAVAASEALTSLHPMQLYFATDMVLVDEVPPAGSLAFPPGWSSCFADPPCAHLGFESEAMREPWALVPGPVTFDIWVVADVPIASTTILDFAGWFGSDVDISAFATTVHGHLLPGEPVHVSWQAEHPETPNVLFPGDAFAAILIAAMTQEVPGTLRLLTGGETPSGISFTMARVDPAALVVGAETTEAFEGQLQGPAFPVTELFGHSERTLATHTIRVPEDAQLLRIDVGGSSPAGTVDLDVDLMDGTRHVGAGHTPRATETIQLAGPALDGLRGRTLDLNVALFFGVDVSYTVDVVWR